MPDFEVNLNRREINDLRHNPGGKSTAGKLRDRDLPARDRKGAPKGRTFLTILLSSLSMSAT